VHEVTEAVQDAVDIGYRSFDCALRYGNEREIGAGLRTKITEEAVTRQELFITSKVRWVRNVHVMPLVPSLIECFTTNKNIL
jgi:Aldo/keto reductases, related to diketogulonate reductase